jgi:hypothetical protein
VGNGGNDATTAALLKKFVENLGVAVNKQRGSLNDLKGQLDSLRDKFYEAVKVNDNDDTDKNVKDAVKLLIEKHAENFTLKETIEKYQNFKSEFNQEHNKQKRSYQKASLEKPSIPALILKRIKRHAEKLKDNLPATNVASVAIGLLEQDLRDNFTKLVKGQVIKDSDNLDVNSIIKDIKEYAAEGFFTKINHTVEVFSDKLNKIKTKKGITLNVPNGVMFSSITNSLKQISSYYKAQQKITKQLTELTNGFKDKIDNIKNDKTDAEKTLPDAKEVSTILKGADAKLLIDAEKLMKLSGDLTTSISECCLVLKNNIANDLLEEKGVEKDVPSDQHENSDGKLNDPDQVQRVSGQSLELSAPLDQLNNENQIDLDIKNAREKIDAWEKFIDLKTIEQLNKVFEKDNVLEKLIYEKIDDSKPKFLFSVIWSLGRSLLGYGSSEITPDEAKNQIFTELITPEGINKCKGIVGVLIDGLSTSCKQKDLCKQLYELDGSSEENQRSGIEMNAKNKSILANNIIPDTIDSLEQELRDRFNKLITSKSDGLNVDSTITDIRTYANYEEFTMMGQIVEMFLEKLKNNTKQSSMHIIDQISEGLKQISNYYKKTQI